jgi:UDP-glucose 4-epimerase
VVRDYLYVADAIEAMLLAAASTHCGAVNIGGGTGLSLNAVIDRIEAALGVTARRKYLPGRPFDVPSNVLDNGLALEVLGWKPRTPFDAGIVATAKYLRRGA